MSKDKAPQVVSTARSFVAHENLIRLSMLRQAGTIEKAALEGVMNSADAIDKAIKEGTLLDGAGRIEIQLTGTELQITDNGRGFQSEEEISTNFETFGTPHEMDDEGCSKDAKFGAFRIGRGQLFAFGKNIWRTGKFEMVVDLPRAKGLSYELIQHPEGVVGCQVTVKLDAMLVHGSLRFIVDKIKEAVRYLDVKVILNGEWVNSPEDHTFNVENDLFKANVKKVAGYAACLRIYNQGVLVEQLRSHEYGVSGDLITKKQIPLNTARNEVMRASKAWKEIHAVLVDRGVKAVTSSERVDMNAAMTIMRRLSDKTISADDVAKIRFIFDVSGGTWSPNSLCRLAGKFDAQPEIAPIGNNAPCVTFMPVGARDGVCLIQAKACLVIDDRFLDGTDRQGNPLNPSSFLDMISVHHRVKAVTSGDACSLLTKSEVKILEEKHWTKSERRAVDLLSSAQYELNRGRRDTHKNRRIVVGVDGDVETWGDGESFIAIARRVFTENRVDTLRGRLDLLMVMLREFVRTEENADSAGLDQEYLENYHELVSSNLVDTVSRMEQSWASREKSEFARDERALAKEHAQKVKEGLN